MSWFSRVSHGQPQQGLCSWCKTRCPEQAKGSPGLSQATSSLGILEMDKERGLCLPYLAKKKKKIGELASKVLQISIKIV